MNLFDPIKAFKEKSVILYFSTGRDSCVMLDIFNRFYTGRIEAIFFYFYKDLPSKNDFLAKTESRYGVKIHRRPILDLLRLKNKGIHWRDIDDALRAEFKIDWIARGYRKDESLSRRGLMKNCQSGKDYKNKMFYPLIDWKEAHVKAYSERERLQLPIEYKYGFRDITIYKSDALLWLANNFPEDYNCILRQYPAIEGELLRAKSRQK
jgi:3'-phosphoadenosine 5'-phosphosulfate sulfotransferase (PAPS reductase)/FAD synthetase